MEKKPVSNIHITLRGPYSELPTGEEISEFECKLRERLQDKKDVILIHGVFEFETPEAGEYHVAIRIQCESLKFVWWKPDFPIEKFGFNPHITIYSGKNKEYRDAIADFFRREKLQVICRKFLLKPYISRQRAFDFDIGTSDSQMIESLLDKGNINPGLLERAKALAYKFMRSDLESALNLDQQFKT